MAEITKRDEFRESTRTPIRTEVRIQFDRSEEFVAYSANISGAGMFVGLRNPRPVGTLVRFEVHLPGAPQPVSGFGEVVWIRTRFAGPGRPTGMGVQFRHMEGNGREVLIEYLRQFERLRLEQTGAGVAPVDEPPTQAPEIPLQTGSTGTTAAAKATTAPAATRPAKPAAGEPGAPAEPRAPRAPASQPAARMPTAPRPATQMPAAPRPEARKPTSPPGAEAKAAQQPARKAAPASPAKPAPPATPPAKPAPPATPPAKPAPPATPPAKPAPTAKAAAPAASGASSHPAATPPADSSSSDPLADLIAAATPPSVSPAPERIPISGPPRSTKPPAPRSTKPPARGGGRPRWLILAAPLLVLAVATALLWGPGRQLWSGGTGGGDTAATLDAPTNQAPPAEAAPTEETGPGAEDAATEGDDAASDDTPEPAQPAAAGDPATEILDVTVERRGARTLVLIRGDGSLAADRVSRLRLIEGGPREVLRITGIATPFRVNAVAANTPQLRRIRLGHHPDRGTGELHLVLDLSSADATVERLESRGELLVVVLTSA